MGPGEESLGFHVASNATLSLSHPLEKKDNRL